jgi:hypothetical protein
MIIVIQNTIEMQVYHELEILNLECNSLNVISSIIENNGASIICMVTFSTFIIQRVIFVIIYKPRKSISIFNKLDD